MYKAALSLILLFLSILTTAENSADKGTVKGRVYDANSNEPLPFTNIVIFGTNKGATTDTAGNFTIRDITPGFVKIAASSVGYESFVSEEIMVTNSKVTFIDVPMVKSNIQLDQVVIQASPFRKTEESPVSMRTLGIKQLERNPGGNRDVSKVIQALPGVASTVSFRNDVIVRGGGPAENKFFLDGMEIPNLNHFATQGASGGPVGIINIDFIREIDFYSGAFPANRGNALSSVMELKQIDGNQERVVTKFAVGASDLSLALNGPISDNTTFLFSARRSYLKFLFDIIGLPFLPTYNDFQFKVKSKLSKKDELTILGIGAIDKSVLNTGIKDPDESQQYILSYLPYYNQWNYAIGAVYKHFRKNSFDTWVFSRNMLNNESYKHENNDESQPLTDDYVSQEIENKIRYEKSARINNYKIIAGAGVEYAKYSTSTFKKAFIPSANDTIMLIDFNSELDLFKWTIFNQVSRSFLSDRLILSLGLRYDGSNYSSTLYNGLNLSPRFSAAYAITPKLFLNMNTGRYIQLPAYTILGYRSGDGRLLNRDQIKYIKSDHAVIGLEYRRAASSRITVEGFYKFYTDYPVSITDSISLANKGGDFGVVGSEEVVSSGKGRAFGVEFYARERIFNTVEIIASYTLVRSEFKSFEGEYIPSAWDNGHLINITLSKEFSKGWYVGTRWRYVGGTPYTPYDFNRSSFIQAYNSQPQGYLDYSRFNTERLKPFHQLDLRIDKQFFFDKWSLTLYTDIQNVYNYKIKERPFITPVTDSNGNRVLMPDDPTRYQLREVASDAGTLLPTVGLIVEF